MMKVVVQFCFVEVEDEFTCFTLIKYAASFSKFSQAEP